MKTKAAFYFLILCQQLLSLERYRRKKGVEVKIHCRTKGVLRYKATIYSTKFGILHTFFRSSLSKLVEREEIGKIFAVVGICQAVISLAGYRYFIIRDMPSCHLSGRIQVLYY